MNHKTQQCTILWKQSEELWTLCDNWSWCEIKFGGDGGGSNPVNWGVTASKKTLIELCG